MALTKKARFDADTEKDTKWGERVLQKSLDDIDEYQQELDRIQDKITKEICAIEKRYAADRKPIYQKRGDSIHGIPNFWRMALCNHPEIAVYIDKSEKDCLNYLTSIEVENLDDSDIYQSKMQSFSLTFNFKENPYFYNIFLKKEYANVLKGGRVPRITVTPILWKEGKDLTIKAQRSFFWWLTYCEDKDMELAEFIKDDMWPNPLQFYLLPDEEESDAQEENGDDTEQEEEMDDVLIVETDDDEIETISDEEDCEISAEDPGSETNEGSETK